MFRPKRGDYLVEQKKMKLLLVDDEKTFIDTLAKRLRMREINVDTVYSGEDALSYLKEEEPDVMVLDLKMPGIHGMKVLKEIKNAYQKLQVIILTGHGSEKDEEETEKLGGFYFLKKPVEMEILLDKIKVAYKLAISINKQNILSQSNKMKAVGTLTVGIAHELNNPINNITLTAFMLLEDYKNISDEEKIEMIGDIINEASRAKKIVSNLLDFASVSESVMGPICIRNLMNEVLKIADNEIKLSGVNVVLKISSTLPLIHGDMQQLKQAFLNVILNALDVTQKGGVLKILVGYGDNRNFIAIKIIDQGPGIPAHILPRIFDPFFTTKPGGKETGLGLSVTQGIIDKHNGSINVTTMVNKGTTFTISLPFTNISSESCPCEENPSYHKTHISHFQNRVSVTPR
jgi:signal transduction histidine kinase